MRTVSNSYKMDGSETDFPIDNGNKILESVQNSLENDEEQSVLQIIEHGGFDLTGTIHGENIFHLLAKYQDLYKSDWSGLFFYHIDPFGTNTDQNTPLMIASFLHNGTFINYIVKSSNHDRNQQNKRGHTALHLCIFGYAVIVKKLGTMTGEKQVTQLCDEGYYFNFIMCVKTLLTEGIDVNIQDKSGKTALMMAVMSNDKYLVGELLKANANPMLLDSKGRSAIQYFDFSDYIDLGCFKLLYDCIGDSALNLPQYNGDTIIQNTLTFSESCEIGQIVLFIKFLIGRNIRLQKLQSSVLCANGQFNSNKFPLEERMKLREIMYFSGAPYSEIINILNFEAEDKHGIDIFNTFCNNLSPTQNERRELRQRPDFANFLDDPTTRDFLLLYDCQEYGVPHSLYDERFHQNNNVNHFSYDFDRLTDGDGDSSLYAHILYLNYHSFYNLPNIMLKSDDGSPIYVHPLRYFWSNCKVH